MPIQVWFWWMLSKEKNMFRKLIIFILLLILMTFLMSCQSGKSAEYESINGETFAANARIGRGVNLGNALEGPREGAWGLYLKPEYFEDIAAAGFDSVRVPIRWSKYTEVLEPYAIQASIFDRIDWVIEQAFSNGLAVIINIHHFDAIMQMPEIQTERLTAIWRQIAERYRDYPDTLYFEILNEPNDKLESELWNQIFPLALESIRETNPERYVIIGPDSWNNIYRLDTLELPKDDRRIIVTFHYYLPHEFTHQGASWTSGADQTDIAWGSAAEVKDLTTALDKAHAWSEQQQRPLFMGEFGVYHKAPEESRTLWISTVRAEAEARGISWTFWDFGTDFAVYNLATKEWRQPILKALLP
jgi:endoglucanase